MSSIPEKIETPYGGQLVFQLPGGSNLIIHLKDKTKIRHKKRWSQVMYMYYLLGYKYFGSLDAMEKLYSEEQPEASSNEFKGFGNFLKNVDSSLRAKVKLKISKKFNK